jgi:hypothetical protein
MIEIKINAECIGELKEYIKILNKINSPTVEITEIQPGTTIDVTEVLEEEAKKVQPGPSDLIHSGKTNLETQPKKVYPEKTSAEVKGKATGFIKSLGRDKYFELCKEYKVEKITQVDEELYGEVWFVMDSRIKEGKESK